MTQDERVIFEMMDSCTSHHKIWMPLVWASLIVRQARREGRCPDDHGQKAVVTEITNLRYNCGKLQEYHTMSVPLVYTQVGWLLGWLVDWSWYHWLPTTTSHSLSSFFPFLLI